MSQQRFINFAVGDLIETPLLYRVSGIYLGANGHESHLELVPLIENGNPAQGPDAVNLRVPVHMVVRGIIAGIFIHTVK